MSAPFEVSPRQQNHHPGETPLAQVVEQIGDNASEATHDEQHVEKTESRADTPAQLDLVGQLTAASASTHSDSNTGHNLAISDTLPSLDVAGSPSKAAQDDSHPKQNLDVPDFLPSSNDTVSPTEPTNGTTQSAATTTPAESAVPAKPRRWYPNVDALFSETYAHSPLMVEPRRPTPEPFTDAEDSKADISPDSPLLPPVAEEIQVHAPFDAMFGEAEYALRLINAQYAKTKKKRPTLNQFYRELYVMATEDMEEQDRLNLLTLCLAYKTKAKVVEYLELLDPDKVPWATKALEVVKERGRDRFAGDMKEYCAAVLSRVAMKTPPKTADSANGEPATEGQAKKLRGLRSSPPPTGETTSAQDAGLAGSSEHPVVPDTPTPASATPTSQPKSIRPLHSARLAQKFGTAEPEAPSHSEITVESESETTPVAIKKAAVPQIHVPTRSTNSIAETILPADSDLTVSSNTPTTAATPDATPVTPRKSTPKSKLPTTPKTVASPIFVIPTLPLGYPSHAIYIFATLVPLPSLTLPTILSHPSFPELWLSQALTRSTKPGLPTHIEQDTEAAKRFKALFAHLAQETEQLVGWASQVDGRRDEKIMGYKEEDIKEWLDVFREGRAERIQTEKAKAKGVRWSGVLENVREIEARENVDAANSEKSGSGAVGGKAGQ